MASDINVQNDPFLEGYSRPTFEAFKAEALRDPEVRAEYDALEDDYQLKRRMIAMRKEAGLDTGIDKA